MACTWSSSGRPAGKNLTQPAPDRSIKGVVSDLFRSRKDLIAENAFLRQQVIILNRQKQGRAQRLRAFVVPWCSWPIM